MEMNPSRLSHKTIEEETSKILQDLPIKEGFDNSFYDDVLDELGIKVIGG